MGSMNSDSPQFHYFLFSLLPQILWNTRLRNARPLIDSATAKNAIITILIWNRDRSDNKVSVEAFVSGVERIHVRCRTVSWRFSSSFEIENNERKMTLNYYLLAWYVQLFRGLKPDIHTTMWTMNKIWVPRTLNIEKQKNNRMFDSIFHTGDPLALAVSSLECTSSCRTPFGRCQKIVRIRCIKIRIQTFVHEVWMDRFRSISFLVVYWRSK